MNLTISLIHNAPGAHHSAAYRRWSGGPHGDRPQLFTTLRYTGLPAFAGHANLFPKLGTQRETHLLERMLAHCRKLRDYVTPEGRRLYYHSGGRYWRKALISQLSSHYKPVTVPEALAPVVFGLLNSQLFYWYWIANSNCMDVVAREVLELPVFPLEWADHQAFGALMERLLVAYDEGRSVRVRRGKRIRAEEANFDVLQARPVIDEIDGLLAAGYGFDAADLDFIRSYDLKYRTGLLRGRGDTT
jgi:hypothetical protein